MLEAFQRGNYELALETFDPDIEGDFTHMPEGRTATGRDEVRREIARWQLTWDELRTDIEELVDAGDKVLLVVRQTGVAKQSRIELDMRYAQIFELEDGRVLRMKTFLDVADARMAAGLR
jgi:ketosteroid isomerase-like protein